MTYIADTHANNDALGLSARGKIIEAHADGEDRICRVIIDLGAFSAEVAALWQEDGFIATASRDGLLMIDGLTNAHPDADLMASVSQQMKHYAMQDAQSAARAEMTGFMPMVQPVTSASLVVQ